MGLSSDNVFFRRSHLVLVLSAFLFSSGICLAVDLEYLAQGSTPFMSSNGRYVAFVGTNLIAPSGEVNQVYLYDRDLDTLELISVATIGMGSANADVRLPGDVGQRAVSDDGRYVVFQSRATNLPGADDPGSFGHIYLRDRNLASTTLLSRNTTTEAPGNFGTVSGEFSIAPDGWGVLFNSTASNLDAGDADNNPNTYLYEVATDSTKLACFDRNGAKINGCSRISLSCTGAMTFVSGSDTVVSDIEDTHIGNDVFYGIPLNGTNTIISVGPSGEAADSIVFSAPSISCDGGRIAFATEASLTFADADMDWDLYVHDLDTGISGLVRAPADVSLRSTEVAMSSDGTFIAFRTQAALDASDDNGMFIDDAYSVFYTRDRLELGAPQLASQEDGEVGNTLSVFPTVGNNGEVAFQSSSSNFGPLDGKTNVYVKGCTPSTLTLDADPVVGAESFEACEIIAGNKEVQGPGGDLTLRAFRVVFESGFVVEDGALLTLEGL